MGMTDGLGARLLAAAWLAVATASPAAAWPWDKKAPPQPSTPTAQGPDWTAKLNRLSEWTILQDKDKKFFVRVSDLASLQQEAATKPDAAATLYEGAIPPAPGWWPSWEAMKHLALWRTEGTLTPSEYTLRAGKKDGKPILEAVKGDERREVYDTGSGSRFTVAKITLDKPKAPTPGSAPAPPAAGTPAPPPATEQPPAEEKPPALEAPPAPAPVAPVRHEPGTGWSADRAATVLFPGEPASWRLITGILARDEASKPGATAAFIAEVQAAEAADSFAGPQARWRGRMNEACGQGPRATAALDQARALAGREFSESDSPEASSAGSEFQRASGGLAGLCRDWRNAPAPGLRGPGSDLRPANPRQSAPEAGLSAPPPPSVADSTQESGKGGKGGFKLSGGIFKFLAVLVGAALGAAIGSIGGPVFGLAGLALGAGLGLYIGGKAGKE